MSPSTRFCKQPFYYPEHRDPVWLCGLSQDTQHRWDLCLLTPPESQALETSLDLSYDLDETWLLPLTLLSWPGVF